MRIVAWNCNRALHRKIDVLMKLRPDLAVLSEAAEPERIVAHAPELANASLAWTGRYPDRGLLVAGFGTTVVELRQDLHDDHLHHMAPICVNGLPGLESPIHLLAVCAQNSSGGNRRKDNPGPLRRALRKYDGFLRSAPAVVAGDFNNNVRWDKPGWPINHANAVCDLARLGLVSAYHVARNAEQGNELEPTYFHKYREEDNFHIDYVFVPKEWSNRAFSLIVGRYRDWTKPRISDHVPLMLEIMSP